MNDTNTPALIATIRFESTARFNATTMEMKQTLDDDLDSGEVLLVGIGTVDKEEFDEDASPDERVTRVEITTNRMGLAVHELTALRTSVQSLAKGFIKPSVHSTVVSPARKILNDRRNAEPSD